MKIKSLYISSHVMAAGKLVVTMGMMEFLKAKVGRVAFFRPFVKSKEFDDDTEFFLERYSLDMTREQTYGFSVHETERLIADGKLDYLLKELIRKIKQLEKDYDFVLIEGLHQSTFLNAIDIDINLEVARNSGIPYVNVLKGDIKSASEMLDSIMIDHEVIKASGCTHFATFVNRLSDDASDELQKLISAEKNLPPTYLLKEIAELDMPTIHEIKNSLGCEVIRADGKDFRRVVRSTKIAAMRLENFLEYIEDGDLILVPADRPDIITGAIMAIYSNKYPNISGIVLTGKMKLSPSIFKILEGFDDFPLPILAIDEDTYQVALKIDQVAATISAKSDRKIALAMGLFNSAIDMTQLDAKIAKTSSSVVTPMMFEYSLFQKAGLFKKKIVLPEAMNDRVLRACEVLLRRDVVDIILLGRPEEIVHRSGSLGLDISKAEIIDPQTSEYLELFAQEFYKLRKAKGMSLEGAFDAVSSLSYFGTMMVHFDYADGMVSGAVHTTQDTIRPALQIIKTKPGIPIVSSLFFMSMDTEVLVYADCAINQDPNAEELATIAITSADTAAQFGIEPRIAMLSYSTGTSGKGEDVQKVAEATEIVRQRRPDLLIEGPIQYDAAVDVEVARKKLPQSKVAGTATVFIFPDLNTGNNTYKAVQRSSGAVAIGPVLQGLKKPINDLSRGCMVPDIVNTIVITAIQASSGETK
ncbi:MAG TPA: phosphate acetyltransferase [Sulfurovum sp.]|nr:phosphate acetyltransferase [Sulfurovum sp.]